MRLAHEQRDQRERGKGTGEELTTKRILSRPKAGALRLSRPEIADSKVAGEQDRQNREELRAEAEKRSSARARAGKVFKNQLWAHRTVYSA
jgi:hypothetical protein